jgi:Holliday junction resolvasome RuvABC DNA-binding subunit
MHSRVLQVRDWLIKNEHQALHTLINGLRALGYTEEEIQQGLQLYLREERS